MEHPMHDLSDLLSPPSFAVRREVDGVAVSAQGGAAVDGAGDRIVWTHEMDVRVCIRC